MIGRGLDVTPDETIERTTPEMTEPDTARGLTLPRLLLANAERHGSRRIAMQEKRYGIWQPVTWERYLRRVRDLAHGLASLGVESGDVVAVLGDDRPEWLITELAVQCLGGAVVGIYPTSVGEEIVHVLDHGHVRVVVAEDQEQVDKLVALKPRFATVEHVVFYDPRGLEHYDQPYLVEFTEVERTGREEEQHRPGWLDERIASGRGGDVAVVCTTSGTTARPKLAMLTHENLLAMGSSLTEIDPIAEDDRYVSFLPLAWIGEQMMSVACGLRIGFTLSFPEAAQTQQSDLREIGPDVLFSPPRIWESMVSDVQSRLSEAGWLKRAVFGWGYAVGDRAAARSVRGERAGFALRLLRWIADVVALRPVREQLGLSRLKRGYTGGAPLGPDVFRFFHAIGVNLKQIYGQTEICGIAVAHPDRDVRFHTVGVPIPGTELRIADDGEILLRSAAVFRGYFRNEEATRAAMDADGWLHTGDAGYLDDGQLVVIDRANDVKEAADGTRFSPAFIENKIKFSPYVEEAVVFGGDDRPSVTAIITIDMKTVATWAEQHHLGYTTYTDLAQKPEVYELIAGDVADANEELPETVRIRRFVLLYKQFDADDDEITRTRKVRRGLIQDRYRDIVDALYGNGESVVVTNTISYQDGTTAERKVDLRIMSLDGFSRRRRSRRRLWRGRRR